MSISGQQPDEGTRTPIELHWFSILQDGAHGFSPLNTNEFEPIQDDVEEENVDEYGVD